MNYFRRGRLNSAKDREGKIGKIRSWGALDLLMYLGGVVLLRNFPFVGEVRLTVLTGFRERAIRSYRTIGRVGPSKRDFTSQSEIIVW
jgi:hypothetical protein